VNLRFGFLITGFREVEESVSGDIAIIFLGAEGNYGGMERAVGEQRHLYCLRLQRFSGALHAG
jgi:hypothetical protein